MIMFHALTGCCPFVSCLDHSQVSKVAQHNRSLFGTVLPLPDDFPERLKAFFRDCWDQKIGNANLVRAVHFKLVYRLCSVAWCLIALIPIESTGTC
jgi:hypothetical protein